jgi:hypothetical protein
MNRKLERNLLRASAVWDVCIGLVTMFGYYPWFEEQGIAAFQNQNQNMRDKQINKGTIRWMIACVIIHLIIYDVIGVVLYLLATTMYMSKNKAIKILKTENGIF